MRQTQLSIKKNGHSTHPPSQLNSRVLRLPNFCRFEACFLFYHLPCSFFSVLSFQPLLGLTKWGWLSCSLRGLFCPDKIHPKLDSNLDLQQPLCLNLSKDLNHSATTAGSRHVLFCKNFAAEILQLKLCYLNSFILTPSRIGLVQCLQSQVQSVTKSKMHYSTLCKSATLGKR